MRANRWVSAALLLVAAMVMARRAGAQTERVHLRYQPHAACPDEQAFAAQVDARTDRAEWVAAGAAERIFEVRLTAATGETDGRLTIRSPGAESTERRVHGTSCQEVVAALALVVALAIDPHARVAPPAPPAAGGAASGTSGTSGPGPAAGDGGEGQQAEGGSSSEPSPTGSGATRGAPATGGTRTPEPTPLDANGSTPPRPPPPRPPAQIGTSAWWVAGVAAPAVRRARPLWRWAVGSAARATSGLGDALAFVLPIYLELERDRPAWWSPSFRLGATLLPYREITVADAGARLSRYAAALSGCPLRLTLLPSLLARPCLALEGGALRGVGLGSQVTKTALAPWLALDLAARVELRPLRWLSLEIDGGGGAALVRPRFLFEPGLTVAQPAALHGTFSGGAKTRFP